MERSSGLKKAYPWLILVSCCFLQGAGLGIIANCAGVFYLPVMQEFGCSMSGISLHVTINNVFQCIGTLFVAKVIRKYKVKYLIPAAGAIVGLAQMSLALSHSLVQWYICAVIEGFFIVYVTGIIVPLTITSWFTKRTGFALGMTAMSAGLVGALMSALLGTLITNVSWRFAVMISGVAILVLTIPTSWFFMAIDPKEKDCVPYGGFKDKDQSDSTAQGHIRFDLRVVSIVMIAFCASFSTIFTNHLPALGEFNNVTIVAPAVLLSICMIGNMSFKIGYGVLDDYIGVRRTTLISFLTLLVSGSMFLMGNDVITCIAAFLLGVNSFISTSQGHLLSKETWSKREYPVALSIVQISVRLSYAIFSYVEGALFDIWGRYKPLILLQIVDAFVGILFLYLLYAARRKRKA